MTAPAWDCHVHVFGDPRRYPFAAERRYTPGEAWLDGLRAHLASVGAERVVLVQPTVYGADHRCLLDALDVLGERAVAVAGWSAATPPPRHSRLRGLRLHLRGRWSEDHARTLRRAADAASAIGCHLELQVTAEAFGPVARAIGADWPPLVLDHFAGFPTGEAAAALDRLLDCPEVHVLASGLDRAPDRHAAAACARHVAARAPGRLLWGSDWPHTPLHPPGEARTHPLPFRRVDDPAALAALAGILGRPALAAARTETPERLYGRPHPK